MLYLTVLIFGRIFSGLLWDSNIFFLCRYLVCIYYMLGTVPMSMNRVTRSFWVVKIIFSANHSYWFPVVDFSGVCFLLDPSWNDLFPFLRTSKLVHLSSAGALSLLSAYLLDTYFLSSSTIWSLLDFFFLSFYHFSPWSPCLFFFLNLTALGGLCSFEWMMAV